MGGTLPRLARVNLYERTVLPNGLRILSSTMPHVRSVSTGIFVGAGSRYEDDALAGASHFIEHMLFKGTAKRPEPQLIAGAIESVGGVFNASTDREATMYYTKVARTHFDTALDVLADMYNAPLFKPTDVDRERGVILEELAMTYDHPDAFADLLIDHALWPDQAMGRDVGGTRDSVGALTREQMLDYHARQYVPANTVVSVAGNIAHDEVVAKVGALLGAERTAAAVPMHPVQATDEQRIEIGNKRTDQTHLCLAVNSASATSEDRYAVDMLNSVLGEGMTSRLFMELRERQGLVYDVHSSAMHYMDCGALVIGCGVDNSNINAALEAILQEIRNIQDNVTSEELSRAIEYAVGRLDLRLEDTRAVMGWMGGQELLRNEVRTPDEVVNDLRAVSTDQVIEAARRYFASGAYKLSIVGPYRSPARFKKLLAA